jgi:hypothetical protein
LRVKDAPPAMIAEPAEPARVLYYRRCVVQAAGQQFAASRSLSAQGGRGGLGLRRRCRSGLALAALGLPSAPSAAARLLPMRQTPGLCPVRRLLGSPPRRTAALFACMTCCTGSTVQSACPCPLCPPPPGLVPCTAQHASVPSMLGPCAAAPSLSMCHAPHTCHPPCFCCLAISMPWLVSLVSPHGHGLACACARPSAPVSFAPSQSPPLSPGHALACMTCTASTMLCMCCAHALVPRALAPVPCSAQHDLLPQCLLPLCPCCFAVHAPCSPCHALVVHASAWYVQLPPACRPGLLREAP